MTEKAEVSNIDDEECGGGRTHCVGCGAGSCAGSLRADALAAYRDRGSEGGGGLWGFEGNTEMKRRIGLMKRKSFLKDERRNFHTDNRKEGISIQIIELN